MRAFVYPRAQSRTPLSARLRAARLAAGLSQVQAATLLGIRQSDISRWESRVPPRLPLLIRAARLYRVSLDALVQDLDDGGDGDEPAHAADRRR